MESVNQSQPGQANEIPLDRQEARSLFTKEADPFVDFGVLGLGVTAEVRGVMYMPEKFYPKGLGLWVDQRWDIARDFPPQSKQWAGREPKQGELLALVLPRQNTPAQRGELSAQRAVLLQLNNIFPEQSAARPVRLFGYGVTENNEPYLIEEAFVGDFKRLDGMGKLQERQALEIALKLAIILQRAHIETEIIYNDIEGGNLDNVFWDPKTRSLRLIDWANAVFNKVSLGLRGASSFGHDRAGLASVLLSLITGKTFSPGQIQEGKVSNQNWNMMSEPTRRFIQKACYLTKEYYDPHNPQDSRKMCEDLSAVYTAINKGA